MQCHPGVSTNQNAIKENNKLGEPITSQRLHNVIEKTYSHGSKPPFAGNLVPQISAGGILSLRKELRFTKIVSRYGLRTDPTNYCGWFGQRKLVSQLKNKLKNILKKVKKSKKVKKGKKK